MKRLLCLALMALLLLSGCAQGTDVSAFAPGEEERLVIYTSHKEEVYGPIIKEFQQRTGIGSRSSPAARVSCSNA